MHKYSIYHRFYYQIFAKYSTVNAWFLLWHSPVLALSIHKIEDIKNASILTLNTLERHCSMNGSLKINTENRKAIYICAVIEILSDSYIYKFTQKKLWSTFLLWILYLDIGCFNVLLNQITHPTDNLSEFLTEYNVINQIHSRITGSKNLLCESYHVFQLLVFCKC
jgi:hypothetical protein